MISWALSFPAIRAGCCRARTSPLPLMSVSFIPITPSLRGSSAHQYSWTGMKYFSLIKRSMSFVLVAPCLSMDIWCTWRMTSTPASRNLDQFIPHHWLYFQELDWRKITVSLVGVTRGAFRCNQRRAAISSPWASCTWSGSHWPRVVTCVGSIMVRRDSIWLNSVAMAFSRASGQQIFDSVTAASSSLLERKYLWSKSWWSSWWVASHRVGKVWNFRVGVWGRLRGAASSQELPCDGIS